MSMPYLQFEKFSVFSALTIQVLQFQAERNDWISIEAPSGFGKTTLIRGMVGLEKTSGKFLLEGKELQDLSPAARNIGVVFQDHLLFSHLTAGENIAYGLTVRGRKAEGLVRARELLTKLNLADKFDAPITVLSGGERQRIAVLRAICFQPKLLILDEPFKGLDEQAKSLTLELLREFNAQKAVPVILVSHPTDLKMTCSKRLVGTMGEAPHVRAFHHS